MLYQDSSEMPTDSKRRTLKSFARTKEEQDYLGKLPPHGIELLWEGAENMISDAAKESWYY